MGSPSQTSLLPPEIFLLICNELAADRAFGTLYQLARISRTVAPTALEQLYSIYDISPAILGLYGKRSWAILWRSILVSTKGQTAYPYAAWIRTLSLGANLDDVLAEMLLDTAVRDMFCAHPLEDILSFRDDKSQILRSTRASTLRRIDTQKTVDACGNDIIHYVRQFADEANLGIALAHLETNSVPSEILSGWCRQLGSGLVSLRLRDGSRLNGEIGATLARDCPNFNDLTLFYCITERRGDPPEDGLTAFLNGIAPNKLRNFDVMRKNNIDRSTLVALARQSKSLRYLRLNCLSIEGLQALDSLTGCVQLECLELENEKYDRTDLVGTNPELVSKLASWIGSCSSLREFRAVFEQDALHLSCDLLSLSNARLESLVIQHFVLLPRGQNTSVFDALTRHKETLREFTIGYFWESDDTVDRTPVSFLHPETPTLLDSICTLAQLRILNLQGAWLDPSDFVRIIENLPKLEEIQVMTHEPLQDEHLLILISRTLNHLKSVMVLTPTNFTHGALLAFAQGLDPIRNNGIQVDFMAQMRESTDAEDVELQGHFSNLGGNLNLGYVKFGDDADESSESEA
ncbi:F-box and leucine-rich repeat protein 2/20 [Microdochium nivale]|nr:F-box and leucine-rich repeat protein 2/20 [Microdochium nivale]